MERKRVTVGIALILMPLLLGILIQRYAQITSAVRIYSLLLRLPGKVFVSDSGLYLEFRNNKQLELSNAGPPRTNFCELNNNKAGLCTYAVERNTIRVSVEGRKVGDFVVVDNRTIGSALGDFRLAALEGIALAGATFVADSGRQLKFIDSEQLEWRLNEVTTYVFDYSLEQSQIRAVGSKGLIAGQVEYLQVIDNNTISDQSGNAYHRQ